MDNEICTIYLGDGALDNDYTVYQSGKIKHFYDRHSFSLNNEEWLKVSDIDDYTKKRILQKCPTEFKEEVEKLFLNA
jgi:hypothetical protein